MASSAVHAQQQASRAAWRAGTGWMPFLAHFLFVLAAWTVTIKYLFPLAYAAAEGEALGTYIYWDLWPVVHVWLGWALLRWPWYTSYLALVAAVAEIVIIVSLFAWFLSDPDWTIWRTNWFINKVFILLCFALILGTFIFGRGAVQRYRQAIGYSSNEE
jgi:hypothetical protein